MPPGSVARPRPDGSMSLLTDLVAHSLDDAYAVAAARRAAATSVRRGRRPGGAPAVLLLAGVLIATAAVQARERAPGVARTRAALLSEVQQRAAATDRLVRSVQQLRVDTGRLRDGALTATSEGTVVVHRLGELELVTGGVPVVGPGIRVRVDDAPTPSPDPLDTDPRDTGQVSRVLDRDLQELVNALWAAGADAVAVNGQRLTATSAIRSAGDAILVDFRPLTPPYTLTAIGDPGSLEARFSDSRAAARLRTYGSVYGLRFSVGSAGRLRLPAAAALALRYARPAAAHP